MTTPDYDHRTIESLAPDERVKVCKYIEMGSCFALDGVRCCVHGTIHSPLIVTAEELNSGTVTHDLVVQRKRRLFAAINDLDDGPTGSCKECAHLHNKPFKDVCFEFLGGEPLSAGFNIQHYTACNQRCAYCCYSQTGTLKKPQYDIIPYLELFRSRGKLRGNNWIDFSGGEPTMLKDFDQILSYLIENRLGTIVVYSNATVFNPLIADALRGNRIILTTSLDTGVASTYRKMRGTDSYARVFQNLIRYRNTGTRNLWIKYVICDENRSDDDLWSFVATVLALRPDRTMICPDFPYGDRQIPEETLQFAARLWRVLEQVTGVPPIDYTSEFGAPKWVKYHCDLSKALEEIRSHERTGIERLKPSPFGITVRSSVMREVYRFWYSGFRKQWLPEGSRGERLAMRVWSRLSGKV